MDRLVHPIPESDFPGTDLGSSSQVDDGRELPGTKSGNGFIAAADAAFAKLRQWDGSNTQPLLLAMFQVATFGLRGINEPVSAKSADYRWLGEQRKLGPYLTEAGQSGAVNQVNLVA